MNVKRAMIVFIVKGNDIYKTKKLKNLVLIVSLLPSNHNFYSLLLSELLRLLCISMLRPDD